MTSNMAGQIDSLGRSSRRAAVISGVGIIILFGSLAASSVRVATTEQHLAGLQQHVRAAEANLASLEKRNQSAQHAAESLNGQIQALQQQLAALHQEATSSSQAASVDLAPKLADAQRALIAIQSTNQLLAKSAGDRNLAQKKEREGYEQLIAGDFEAARAAFQAADDAYPGYHSVHEIAQLLRSRTSDSADASARRAVLRRIHDTLNYGAPADLLARLKARSEE